jgi:hypothetical protein
MTDHSVEGVDANIVASMRKEFPFLYKGLLCPDEDCDPYSYSLLLDSCLTSFGVVRGIALYNSGVATITGKLVAPSSLSIDLAPTTESLLSFTESGFTSSAVSNGGQGKHSFSSYQQLQVGCDGKVVVGRCDSNGSTGSFVISMELQHQELEKEAETFGHFERLLTHLEADKRNSTKVKGATKEKRRSAEFQQSVAAVHDASPRVTLRRDVATAFSGVSTNGVRSPNTRALAHIVATVARDKEKSLSSPTGAGGGSGSAERGLWEQSFKSLLQPKAQAQQAQQAQPTLTPPEEEQQEKRNADRVGKRGAGAGGAGGAGAAGAAGAGAGAGGDEGSRGSRGSRAQLVVGVEQKEEVDEERIWQLKFSSGAMGFVVAADATTTATGCAEPNLATPVPPTQTMFEVVKVVTGSQAALQGLKIGDELVGVNGISLNGQKIRCAEEEPARDPRGVGTALEDAAERVGLTMLGEKVPAGGGGLKIDGLKIDGVGGGILGGSNSGGSKGGGSNVSWHEREQFQTEGGPRTTAQLVRLLVS